MTKLKSNPMMILIFAVLLCGVCATASASPIVDGIYSSTEGYDVNYRLDFYSDGALVADGGEIYMYQERGVGSSDPSYLDTYVAFIVPLSLNDNLYGDVNNKKGKHPTPVDYPSWDYGGHGYGDLVESDLATFTAYDEVGTLVFDFSMPYFGDTPVAPVAPVSEWNTSLAYNLDNYSNPDGLDLTSDSPFPQTSPTGSSHVENGWYFNMIYEFKIDGDAFNNNDLNIVVIGQSHNSPVKLGKKKDNGGVDAKQTTPVIEGTTPGDSGSNEYAYNPAPPPGPAPVPEPATIILFGVGIGAIGFLGRKRFIV